VVAKIFNRLPTIKPWLFLGIIILAAEILTLILNSLQSYLRWGQISRELIEIGAIDALIVSLIVAPIIIYSLAAYNEKLKQELADRRDIEEALKESEQNLRLLFDSTSDGIFILDMQGHFVDVNRTAYERLGYTREEMLSMKISELDPPEFASRVPERLARIREHGHAVFESAHLRKDGSQMPVEVNSRMLEYMSRNIYFSVIRDITERKRVEMKLREGEQFIRNVLDSVDEGFIVVDQDFRILTANNAYCCQVGESCEAIIGRHCYEISHKTLRPCYEEGEECAVRHVFETGKPHTALHRHPDGKGSVLYVETKAFPLKDSTGTVSSVIETVMNITEKHLLEEEQLKTQKLEAIGTLAGGIAHDFNNLLQGVFGYISMAKITLDQKERSLMMLEQAEKALHMSVNLTTQLLTFSKGGKPVKKNISLQPVIENSVRFALSGSSVSYRIKSEENLWPVDADEGQIGQVIQNIVLNADQAMPAGGTIVIAAKNLLLRDRGQAPPPEEGKYVQISIQDNGTGIPESHIPRIFDPYFTTKEKGSGLGLATSYSIIKNHGGFIDVTSEPGRGTTFFIYLPAVEAEREVSVASAVSGVVRKGKVLVMDDEELVRNLAEVLVRVLGHEVEVAEHGEAAIGKYQAAKESGARFDIVILDLTVRGGLGGRETIERLVALDPAVSAVVSSGYSDDAVIADYQKYGFRASLAKPYKLEELRDTLNALLG